MPRDLSQLGRPKSCRRFSIDSRFKGLRSGRCVVSASRFAVCKIQDLGLTVHVLFDVRVFV